MLVVRDVILHGESKDLVIALSTFEGEDGPDDATHRLLEDPAAEALALDAAADELDLGVSADRVADAVQERLLALVLDRRVVVALLALRVRPCARISPARAQHVQERKKEGADAPSPPGRTP